LLLNNMLSPSLGFPEVTVGGLYLRTSDVCMDTPRGRKVPFVLWVVPLKLFLAWVGWRNINAPLRLGYRIRGDNTH